MSRRSRQASGFLATVRAVLWSFIGIRRKSDYQRDAARLKPVHVIVAGLAAGAAFVLLLMAVVKLVMLNLS